MRRRRLLLGMGPVALLGMPGVASLLWLTRPTPGVTWENFHRLRFGMTARDVEALLGEPQEVDEVGGDWTTRRWRGDDFVISLSFDADQKLAFGGAFGVSDPTRAILEPIHADESFLDRIRRLLHL